MGVFHGCFPLEELAELGIELLQRVAAAALGAGPAVKPAHIRILMVELWSGARVAMVELSYLWSLVAGHIRYPYREVCSLL